MIIVVVVVLPIGERFESGGGWRASIDLQLHSSRSKIQSSTADRHITSTFGWPHFQLRRVNYYYVDCYCSQGKPQPPVEHKKQTNSNDDDDDDDKSEQISIINLLY